MTTEANKIRNISNLIIALVLYAFKTDSNENSSGSPWFQ